MDFREETAECAHCTGRIAVEYLTHTEAPAAAPLVVDCPCCSIPTEMYLARPAFSFTVRRLDAPPRLRPLVLSLR